MLKNQLLAIAMLSAAATSTPLGAQPAAKPRVAVVIRDVSVLSATASAWLTHRDIVIRDTTIGSIAPTGVALPAAKVVINGAGKFVIPGLFDNRVRLAELWPSSSAQFIAYGVTSVRDVGTAPELLAQWRRDLANGKVMGPRILASPSAASAGTPSSGAGESTVPAGRGLLDEVMRLVADGRATTAEALRLATIESARAQNRDADLGSIEAGKNADLIVLDADPLADIRGIQAIDAVIFRGETLTRAHLNMLRSPGAAPGARR